ncbi:MULTISPECIES: transglutaminase family protein [unclassified Devosia]|uniref:transglutaminase family protein n=1 Tax=unclassified Devosia TaxID=196773 RepID=UPI000927ED0F|nr:MULTISPECIES: transglutaminase family protein [unclassified Devosia]MBL8597071.1 transglutaminase family protein [Devosia sp.]OJX51901.1 MAG: transglutaminase [Devosia sp. 66-22]
MLYDVRLELHYDYEGFVHGDRHLIRVAPQSIPGVQRVVASAVSFDPRPDSETSFVDFFGNLVTTISYAGYHDSLDVRLSARVAVEDEHPPADLSPDLMGLQRELATLWTLDADSPHHFLAPSPRVAFSRAITDYARKSVERTASVRAAAMDLCLSIHRDFVYDKDSTDVNTAPLDAFTLRKGVCQDFVHVMVAGLRGVGIPAAYVSGFLRTIPPKGKPRLEGADAMHAWVRVWCGLHDGWLEFDPTNAMLAGADHITIGHGRDYADISPIVGVLRTSGRHETKQSVDVIRVE